MLAVAAKAVLNNWSWPIKSSPEQPSGTNHITVSRCHHSDDEVVIHSTNGHTVFIIRLLSMSKIQAFPGTFLRAFYTVRYLKMPNGSYTFEKQSVALP